MSTRRLSDRLPRLAGATLALLAVAGCDGVDCEGVQPCRDGISVRIVPDTPVSGPRPFPAGTYAVAVTSDLFDETCAFEVTDEWIRYDGALGGRTCDDVRIDLSQGEPAIRVDYPLVTTGALSVTVALDGAPIGEAVADVSASLVAPAEEAFACRARSCRQARVEVPVDVAGR